MSRKSMVVRSLMFFAVLALVAMGPPAAHAGLGQTVTPTGIPGGTATATVTPDGDTTPTSSPTMTGTPGGTATATITPTGGGAGTPTRTMGGTTASPTRTGGGATVSPTPSAGTRTPSPIVTPSAGVTGTPSPGPVRTATPIIVFEDDGCQVAPTAGSSWPLLVGLGALWLRRRRR